MAPQKDPYDDRRCTDRDLPIAPGTAHTVIEAVQQALRGHGLEAQPGPMSTYVVGEADCIFAALREAFVQAAATGHVVMTVTVSNACPVPD
jgi:uncharacterized protein YqgV (UPF0045/DUF77 family)